MNKLINNLRYAFSNRSFDLTVIGGGPGGMSNII
jgi:hypothetical protein